MKKIFKKLFNLTCAVAMMSYMFAPLSVLATDSIVLTFTIENTTAFPSMEAGSGENTDKGPLTIHSTNGTDSIRVLSGGADITNEVTYECTSQVSCKITMAKGDNRNSISIGYHTDWMNITKGEDLVTEQTVITESTTLVVKEVPNQGGNPDEKDHRYRTRARSHFRLRSRACRRQAACRKEAHRRHEP